MTSRGYEIHSRWLPSLPQNSLAFGSITIRHDVRRCAFFKIQAFFICRGLINYELCIWTSFVSLKIKYTFSDYYIVPVNVSSMCQQSFFVSLLQFCRERLIKGWYVKNLPPEGPGAGLANPSQGSWKLAIVWVFLEPIEVRKFIHTQKRKKKRKKTITFRLCCCFCNARYRISCCDNYI